MSERISPLRRCMIEDMTIRDLPPATQRSYIHAVKRSRNLKLICARKLPEPMTLS
jgi:hypothetical protein